MKITISMTGDAPEAVQAMRSRLADPASIHAKMATAAEGFLKEFGAKRAAVEHRTAQKLGGKPTGHLGEAYAATESTSNAQGASLFLPRASRLRAAFGSYTARPGAGKQYLTIPVSGKAYGRRAREIPGLVFLRLGPKKTLFLAEVAPDLKITPHYVLIKEAHIKEDPTLVPFEELTAEAADAAELYILKGDKA